MIILIAGVSRSGKTTLAHKLCRRFGMSYFPLDPIVSTLENLYPDMGIQHLDDNLEFSKQLAVFIAEFKRHLEYEDLDMVVDTYQLFPDDYVEVLLERAFPIVYLGYPHILAEDKLLDIRKYQRKKDWTQDVDDHQMIPILIQYIAESKVMQSQCLDHRLPFFDTGTDFLEAQEGAFLYLKREIGMEKGKIAI